MTVGIADLVADLVVMVMLAYLMLRLHDSTKAIVDAADAIVVGRPDE